MAEFTADLSPKGGIPLMDMMKMQYYGAQADIASKEAEKARMVQAEMPLVQSFMADPENKLKDGSFDLDKINRVLPTIAPFSGIDYAKKITDITKNHIETNRALNELSTQQRSIFSSIYGAHAAAGTQDPKQVAQSLERLKVDYPQLAKAVDGQMQSMLMAPAGPEFNKKLFQARNEVLSPKELIDQFAPKANLTNVGGAVIPTITKPSVGGEAPTVSTGNLGGGVPSSLPSAGEGGATSSKLPRIIQEDASMNYTGPAHPLNLSDIQKEAYGKGKEVYRAMPAATTAAQEGKQYVRKVEQYASTASGSGLYKTGQDWARFVASNPDLDVLNKNIAGVMVQNANAMGLNKTDSSRGDAETLSGSSKISPEALRDIMQRADAQFSATELFAKGLDKYHQKRGEINASINTDKFQNAWANNYDSRIFQLDNIAKSNWPEKVKEQKTAEIVDRMSESEYKDFVKKAKTIHRLAEGLHQ